MATGNTHEGLDITFRNLHYSVDVKQGDKKGETLSILVSLDGYFQKNSMVALMGPSGAGKTTLLDILSGRKNQGTVSGDINFGGLPPSPVVLKRYTGYVEQFDTLLDILTVEEMLLYTSELKCPQSEPLQSKQRRVDALVEELGLTACKKTVIGNVMARGISGGQAKRVNIGIALITEPRILFLDEPTSGLDSAIAHDVMGTVKELAKHGRTVCATIHSPSSETFRLFDRLYLLAKGRNVFFGDPQVQAIPYFQDLGFEFQTGDSVSDWLLLVTGGGVRNKSTFDFAQAYMTSQLNAENHKALEDIMTQDMSGSLRGEKQQEEDKRADKVTAVSFPFAVKTLFKYRSLKSFKDPQYIGQRVGDKILLSLVIMSVYWQHGKDLDNPTYAMNVAASLFMFVTLPAYGAASYTPSIVLDRPVFYRERHDGCYTTLAYLTSKVVEEGIMALISTMVFVFIPWYAIGLDGHIMAFFCVFYMSLNIGIVLAYFFAAISPNMEVANASLPAYITINLFFSGLLVNYSSIPLVWSWYSRITHMRYGWTALMANQFKDYNPVVNGVEILDFYHIEGGVWENFAYLSIFYVAFFLMAWVGMEKIDHSSK